MAYNLPRDAVVIDLVDDSDNDLDLAFPRAGEAADVFDVVGGLLDDAVDDEWAAILRIAEEAERIENQAPVFDADIVDAEEEQYNEDQPLPSEADLLEQELEMQDLIPPALLSEDDCLRRILEVFPDIAHDHVLQLYRDKFIYGLDVPEASAVATWCSELIVQLLESKKYPKERERRQELKRKREEDDPDHIKEFEKENREDVRRDYLVAAQRILENEFYQVPIRFIKETLQKHRYLFKAYVVLAAAELEHDPQRRGYRRCHVRLPKPAPEGSVMADGKLLRELGAARRRREQQEAKRKIDDQKALAEQRNEEHARRNKAMSECGCCFTDYPTNRMTYCNGDTAHFFCFECAASYIKAEVGQSRCRPKCMDTSGCGADFTRTQLKSFLDPKTFDKLESLQQQEDIRNAGLEDLAECPFCDFKAICPPVEVDREFRCRNTECEKISCRLCKLETHIPLTCEQHAKDRKGNLRHAVEEAMSEALIRSCNRCKNKFIKEIGCNKMSCTSCGNKQCYVCSQDVHDYHHFGTGRCPLYDDTDARHDDEVKAAEAAALKKAREENPDMNEDELKVKVSDAVKEQERRAREQRGRRRPEDYARMNADHAAMLGAGAGHVAGGMPHVHIHGLHQAVPLVQDVFGPPPFFGMPAHQPHQVPQLFGGFGVPVLHNHPHGIVPPPHFAAHFAAHLGLDQPHPFGVAPQPFANYPHVYNHADWVDFMQREHDRRHRGH